jgi:hypothetical protein
MQLLNYTFLCNTPFHVYISYVIACLLKQNRYSKKNTFNLVLAGSLNRYQKTSSDNSKFHWTRVTKLGITPNTPLFKKICLMRLANKKILKYIKNHHIDYLFVFNDCINSVFLEYFKECYPHSKVILVEEGVAPYVTPSKARPHKLVKFIKKMLGFPNHEGKYLGELIQPDYCIVSRIDRVREGYGKGAFFIEWPPGAFPKDISLDFIRLYMEDIDFYNYQLKYHNNILLLTSPLSEEGLLTIDQELSHLSLVKEISYRLNKKIFVKPHPRENERKIRIYKDMGFEVLDFYKDIPIELLLIISQPEIVITAISSGAINYSFRNNGKVIWLGNLLFPSSKQISLIDQLVNENKLFAPSDTNELENIESIIQKKDTSDDQNLCAYTDTDETAWSKIVEHFI